MLNGIAITGGPGPQTATAFDGSAIAIGNGATTDGSNQVAIGTGAISDWWRGCLNRSWKYGRWQRSRRYWRP